MIGPWPAFFTGDDWTSPFQCGLQSERGIWFLSLVCMLRLCSLEIPCRKTVFTLVPHHARRCCLNIHQHCRGKGEKNESVFPLDQYSNLDHSKQHLGNYGSIQAGFTSAIVRNILYHQERLSDYHNDCKFTVATFSTSEGCVCRFSFHYGREATLHLSV